jgi:hypothetical protein
MLRIKCAGFTCSSQQSCTADILNKRPDFPFTWQGEEWTPVVCENKNAILTACFHTYLSKVSEPHCLGMAGIALPCLATWPSA